MTAGLPSDQAPEPVPAMRGARPEAEPQADAGRAWPGARAALTAVRKSVTGSMFGYIATASAVAVLLAMIATTLLYRHYAIKELIYVAQDQNVVFARSMSNTVRFLLPSYFASFSERDPRASDPVSTQIDTLLRTLAADLPVLKIKMYRRDGLTMYSSEQAQIGEMHERDEVFRSAAGTGVAQSKFSYRDQFSAFSGEIFGRDVVESYVPIRLDSEEIVGVFELYTDVTSITDQIDRTTFVIAVTSALVFALLYGTIVLFIMHRAIAPLRRASAQAERISPHTSGIRLPAAGMPSELVPLVTGINSALDRLDAALDAQRRFSADAAHELLTPLAVLQASIDTLDDKQAAESLRSDVATVSEVITQLLELAELEALTSKRSETADLRDVCTDVASSLRPLAKRDEKDLALSTPDEPVVVRGQDKILDRAIRNVLSNAIVHSRPGTTVEIVVCEDGSVSVRDRGPGVPPEDRERIFDRFWRGPDRRGPGTGLGLAIVKHSVEIFGGSVEVGDAPGGGAVFTIRLPLASPAHARDG